MKRETENKQVFSFKKGHTLPMSDEYLDFLENCQKALLIGNLRGMIVDTNDDGKPSFFQTSGICNEKAKMALTFYKRFSDINKFTHFLVHEDNLQYYKDFIENFALENCQIITHRLRGKSTEYKIAFVPPVVSIDFKSSFNIRNEYLQDMETLAKFEVGSDEQDKQIKYMLQKYVAICLNYTDGKLNEVFTDHGNITVIVYKDNKMFTNVYSKVNKLTGEKIEIRDFDNIPKMFNARINGFKGKKTMTYDFILMNPPYDKNLHLKIVEQSIPMLTDDGILVNLSPIRWLQDPLAKYKKTSDWYRFKEVRERIESLVRIDTFVAAKMFDINSGLDLGVYKIRKFYTNIEQPTNSIIDKVVKTVQDTVGSHTDKDMSDGWRVRVVLMKPLATHHNNDKTKSNLVRMQYVTYDERLSWVYKDGYTENGIHWTQNVVAKCGHELPVGTDIPVSIPFPDKEKAVNFEESTRSLFYRYLHLTMKGSGSQEPLGYLPWMGDCTNPRTGLKRYGGEWTDEDFCKYFGITDSEWKEIVETMKPYL